VPKIEQYAYRYAGFSLHNHDWCSVCRCASRSPNMGCRMLIAQDMPVADLCTGPTGAVCPGLWRLFCFKITSIQNNLYSFVYVRTGVVLPLTRTRPNGTYNLTITLSPRMV